MKVIFCQLENHLKGIRDAESKLSKMIWLHLHHNDIHKNYGRVLLLECRSNKNFYESPTYNDFRKYAGIMLKILEEGVKQGLFRDNVNMRLVRDIIFGTLDYENLSCL
ncbi:MAG: TetR family transcriptional regulator, partial [Desulfobacteraceae bacterium 4484_190.1]